MGSHHREPKLTQVLEFLQRFVRGELHRHHLQVLITASSEEILSIGRAPVQVDLPNRLLRMSVEELIRLAESEGLKVPPRSAEILQNSTYYSEVGPVANRLRGMCIRSSFEEAANGTAIDATDERGRVAHQLRRLRAEYPNGARLQDLLRLWLHARTQIKRTIVGFADGITSFDEVSQKTELVYPHIVLDEEGNAKLSFYPEENFFPGDVYYVASIEK